ncbi:pyruvate dehydrogenase complex dihydrolipoamide acetyltransferase [Aquibaculum sediminis]|uniref:pyruvate dehydrogenase complex dihydrolipoamide acetyltransferase n=1 Tax=Aquibaculum sediminis TaxID=3231907 RepID=UPI00345364E8
MTIEVLMPALSPTMTEGKLAKWHKQEGDEVAAGDIIAEIETDKATMEVEAVDEGRLGKILVEEGTEGVPVNQAIAVLLEEGEDESALKSAGGKKQPEAKSDASNEKPAPKDSGEAQESASSDEKAAAAEKSGAAQPASQPAAPPAPKGADGERIFASPLARRMAEQAGLDLASLKGSGPKGRIVKADIDAALSGGEKQPEAAAAPSAPQAAAAPAAPTPAGPGAKQLADMLGMAHTQEPLSGMRRTIAKRLSESKQQVPHFYLTVDCELDTLLATRKQLNERTDGETKISVNDFVIRAAALALKQVPAANASYDEGGMLFYEHADISVAVATPNGLITPIVKQAEGKGLATIAREMKDLAGRARENKLKPEEYQGGTFSVSNLGMFGVKQFDAIINPPQGCILAIGAGEQRAVVKEGALAIATVMSCTLSVDHRVVDGAVGAEFLAAFKKLIEDPLSMLL